jgi:hypothetical protein
LVPMECSSSCTLRGGREARYLNKPQSQFCRAELLLRTPHAAHRTRFNLGTSSRSSMDIVRSTGRC